MNERIVRFFCRFTILTAAGICCILLVSGLFITYRVHGTPINVEIVDEIPVHPLLALIETLGFGGAVCLAYSLLRRWRTEIGARTFFLFIWFFCSCAFLVVSAVQQTFDYQTVLEAAERFASGSYSLLSGDYFNAYPYQLTTIFPMELLIRLFPQIHPNRAFQILNLFASFAAGWGAAVCGEILCDADGRRGSWILFGLSIPTVLYCIFVYGTLYMIALDLVGAAAFLVYCRKGQKRYGILAAVTVALGCVMKVNGFVPVIALSICLFLHALRSGKWRHLLLALLCVLLSLALTKGVVCIYELRSDIRLQGGITWQARLAMGMQDNGPASGWFNNYTTQFLPLNVSRQEQISVARAEISNRVAWFISDPAAFVEFLREKFFSQWLDPTYGTIRYGQISPRSGELPVFLEAIFDDTNPLHWTWLESMRIYQISFYCFAAAGLLRVCIKDDQPEGAALLPLSVLGGLFYHMLFEAKSCYIYPYIIALLPYAGNGVMVFTEKSRLLWRRIRYSQSI